MTRTITEQFVGRVEAFLTASGVKPSEFGRSAIGDRSFVLNLRRGRSPTLATADKVLSYIDKLEAEAARRPPDRREK
ncbi:MAG: hypothetical protein AB7O88_22065 [Reyranellaceae bacterium]